MSIACPDCGAVASYGREIGHKTDCPALRDPRDPDYTKTGMFVLHNCWRCQNGAVQCVSGDPRQCEYPHARND